MRSFVAGLLLIVLLAAALPPGSIQPATAIAQAEASDASTTNIFNTSAGPVFTLPQWTDGSGWSSAEYYATIQLADVDGDGTDELLGRGAFGMIIQSWDATTGLWTSVSESGPFSDAGGWIAEEYYATIQAADIDGDGAAELIARSSVGIDTYKWSGTAWTQLAAGAPDFGDGNGWDKKEYYSTIQTADIDGDGAAEMLARSTNGIETYKWSGSAWTQVDSKNPPWSDKEGWEKHEYYSTIQTGDIDGDGAAELLGRGGSGIDAYKWSGSSWSLLKADSPNWSDKEGWNKSQYYSTIQTGDIDGDGADELLGRAAKGMDTNEWNGSDWTNVRSDSPSWSDDAGWDKAEYYATIQTGDFNGDGAAELLARSATAIESYGWHGSGWTTIETDDPKLSDSHWANEGNYSTIQMGDIDGDGDDDLVARGLYGIRTWSFNALTANAWDNPVGYGFSPFTGTQLDAYNFINSFLTLASGETLRGQYATDANTLSSYQTCLLSSSANNEWEDWTALPTETCIGLGDQTAITAPSGLTLADWNTVAKGLYDELGSAQAVSDYYADLLTLYVDIFGDEKSIMESTAQTLLNEDLSEKKVDALFESLFLAPFKLGPLAGPAGSAISGILSALMTAALSAASSDTFEGTWADALNQFTTMTEGNEDAINAGHAYVVGDPTLMTFVGAQKNSGAWDPSDPWIVRSMTSEGRIEYARWIYQTLTPTVWKLSLTYWVPDILGKSDCSAPKDEIYNYFTNDNGNEDCYRTIVQKDFLEDNAPTSILKNIMDAVSDDCTATESNSVTWEFGNCDLGVSKKEFFLNENGWNFETEVDCVNCSAYGPSEMDVTPNDPANQIDLSDPGHAHVTIYGSQTFDAQTVIPSSLNFAGASPIGWWSDDDDWHPAKLQDRNGDGYIDVMAAFLISDMVDLQPGDTEATLTGSTTVGSDFTLTEPVTIISGP